MSQQMKIALTVIAAAGTGQLQKMAKVAEIVEKAQADISAIGGVTAEVETSSYTPRPQGVPRKPRTPAAPAPVLTPPAPTPIENAAKGPAANTEATKADVATPPKPAWASQADAKAAK